MNLSVVEATLFGRAAEQQCVYIWLLLDLKIEPKIQTVWNYFITEKAEEDIK